jgi:hypothetical protein
VSLHESGIRANQDCKNSNRYFVKANVKADKNVEGKTNSQKNQKKLEKCVLFAVAWLKHYCPVELTRNELIAWKASNKRTESESGRARN